MIALNYLEPSIITKTCIQKFIIQRRDSLVNINITDKEKRVLMNDIKVTHFSPITHPDSVTNKTTNYLKYNEKRKTFNDAVSNYLEVFKVIITTLFPDKEIVSGPPIIIPKVKTINVYLYFLAFSSIIIALINLIPIPGLDAGNTVIALIEKIRRKKFNNKILKTVKGICSGVIILAILFLFIFSYLSYYL